MKRLYSVLAALAFGLLLVQTGFVATLAARGQLGSERISRVLRTLRDNAPSSPSAASAPASQAAASMPASRPAGDDDASIRARGLALERREREIADQWNLLREAQIELVRDREKFSTERQEWEAALKRQAQEAALSGAAKELDYLSSIKAEIAKDLLRQKKDPDVVGLMLQMETRTGRKIIESCKTDEERQWIGRILEQLRQRNQRQAEALGAGKP